MTGSVPWRSLKHGWLCHILSTHPGKGWSQFKLNQRPSVDNNHWIWRLYDLDQIFGDFPFHLLPFTVLPWDDLRTRRIYEGSSIRNIQNLLTVHLVQATFISQVGYWVAYLLVWLCLLLPTSSMWWTQQCTITSYFSGGPFASTPGSTVSKQSSAVSHSGVVQVTLLHGHCHCH